MSSVCYTGTSCLAVGIFYIEHTACVALYVALFRGLSNLQHELPPLKAVERNGRPSVG